ncbi:MAG TPA: M28 family peptidase [Terriglobales bacterium]|nr:M28 family peptidase [Terriglobales bacterium]
MPTAKYTFETPAKVSLAADNASLRDIVAHIQAENIKADVQHLVDFGTRNATEETDSTTSGTAAARAWIKAEFDRISAANGGRLQVKVDTFPVPAGGRVPKAGTMANVIATLPGDDANNHQVFIIGGDYDTIGGFGGGTDDRTPTVGPGANDDASGVAVALECARAMSKYHFPATLEFIAFDGEEEGLYGAYHDAEQAHAAQQDVVAMLDNDIVGGDNTPGHANTNQMRVYSPPMSEDPTEQEILRLADIGGENDFPARELGRYASGIAAVYLPNFQVVQEYRRDRFSRGGDAEAYQQNNYTAVRFSDFYENYDHQHQWKRVYQGVQFGDLIQFTTPSYTANVARVNALTAASLALAPPAPESLTQRRAGWGTHLSWKASPGAVSYRILMRPTADAQWTERLVVNGTEVQIEQTLDDYMMAVVAVGKDGTESLPVLPTAGARKRGSPYAAGK